MSWKNTEKTYDQLVKGKTYTLEESFRKHWTVVFSKIEECDNVDRIMVWGNWHCGNQEYGNCYGEYQKDQLFTEVN